MAKRTSIGIVTRDKATKTRRVEIARLVRHPQYGKFLKERTICYVHDETEASHVGDTVEIVECRPRSHLKRYELVRIVSKSQAVDLSALKAARSAAAHDAKDSKEPVKTTKSKPAVVDRT